MKKLLASAVVAAIGLSTISTFAFNPGAGDVLQGGESMRGQGMFGMKMRGHDGQGPMMEGAKWGSEAIKKAFESKDYDAFVTAWNADQAKLTVPTTEEFAKMVERQKIHDQIELAIANSDYTSFVAAIKLMPKPEARTLADGTTQTIPELIIPTQDEFDKLVQQRKNQEAVKKAIGSNDYDGFVKARTASKPTLPSKEEFTAMLEKFAKKTVNHANNTIKKVKRVLKIQ